MLMRARAPSGRDTVALYGHGLHVRDKAFAADDVAQLLGGLGEGMYRDPGFLRIGAPVMIFTFFLDNQTETYT